MKPTEMNLPGLRKRNSLCKICCSFEDSVLTEITLDILLRRKSNKEIIRHYTPLLPLGMKKINEVNINNHRKHSDSGLLANQAMKANNEPTTDAEMISYLYGERFKEAMDKRKMLIELYRERLNNLFKLQEMMSYKERDLKALKRLHSADPKIKESINSRQDEVRGYITQIDKIQSSLQDIVLKEFSNDKSPAQTNININQTFISSFEGNLKVFMKDIIQFVSMELLKDDEAKAKLLIRALGAKMDQHISATS